MRNLAVAAKWAETWNTDVERMIEECYASDCEVFDMHGGHVFHGRDGLREIEHQMLAAAPSRKMVVNRAIAGGDTVVMECDVIGFTPEPAKACAVLTFRDGKIVTDHSYGPPAPR
jgi:predicted SnoaL-like aldol condensation-catalyzing enzyme